MMDSLPDSMSLIVSATFEASSHTTLLALRTDLNNGASFLVISTRMVFILFGVEWNGNREEKHLGQGHELDFRQSITMEIDIYNGS